MVELIPFLLLVLYIGTPLYVVLLLVRSQKRQQREKEHERELLNMRAEHAERMLNLRRQAQREGLLHPADHELDDALR